MLQSIAISTATTTSSAAGENCYFSVHYKLASW